MAEEAPQGIREVPQRLQEVVSHLKHRIADLRSIQYSLKEAGDDERSARIEKVADSFELAISQIARQHKVLTSTPPNRITGEWRPPAPGKTEHITGEWKPIVRKKKKP